MKPLKKSFWKTYCIDILLFLGLFVLGAYAKTKVATFFSMIQTYQSQIQQLEPGLANQSTTALLQMEVVVNQFSHQVKLTYLLMVILVPLLTYLLFTITQSINVSIILKKVEPKFIFKSVLLGTPFLLLFYVLENTFVRSFAFFLDTMKDLTLFISIILLIFILMYVWYSLVIGYLIHEDLLFKQLYKKILRWGPYYLLMMLSFFSVFSLMGFALVRYLTASFIGREALNLGILVLGLLALAQFFRYKLVKNIQKYH